MALGTQHDQAGLRYLKTSCLSAAFFVLGLVVALLGPTVPTLAYNIGAAEEDLSFVYTARGIGYLGGSLLCAILFKRMNGYLVIALSLILITAGNCAIPFMPYVALIGLAVIIPGATMGILDSGGNVLCLNLWGTESEPWMQTMHFFFAFGATLSPLLAKPFIRESQALITSNEAKQIGVSEASVLGTTAMGFDTSHIVQTTLPTGYNGQFPYVAWAFLIASAVSLLVSAAFCFLSFSKNTKTESQREDTVKLEGKAYRIKIMALLFVFYLLDVGTEVTFGLFIYTFAINCDRHYSKETGTILNSFFWGSFAVGRFCAIFFTKCVSPRTMLIFDLIGTTISTVVMSFFQYYSDNNEWLLWASVALYGWSLASLFPTGITWAEHYITVTEKSATVFVVGASLGEMALPFIMSHMISRNPMNLMYFCVISTGICIVDFLVLVKIATARGARLNLTKSKSSIEMDEDVKPKYDRVPTNDSDLNSEKFVHTE